MNKTDKPLPKDTAAVLDLIKQNYLKHMMYGSCFYGGYDYSDVDIVLFDEHQEEVRNFLGRNNITVEDGAPGSVGSILTKNTIPVNIICLPSESYAACRIARDFMQLVKPIVDKDKRYGAFLTVFGLIKASGFVPASGSYSEMFGPGSVISTEVGSDEMPF